MTSFTPFLSALLTFLGLLIGVYALAVMDDLFLLGARHWRLAFVAPVAHAADLLRQRDRRPAGADTFLYQSAPLIAVVTVALAALVIPVGAGLVGFDPSIGLFYFIVLLSPFVIAMMNAGWSQNSKVGLIGTFRAAAHLISYEVPLGFAAIGAPMAAQSLAMGHIVTAQSHLWFAVWQPLGVIIYLVAALFPAFRHPFDAPYADSELEGGVLAQYTGVRLLLFQFALKAMFLLLMAAGVTLFFGGWQGPFLPGPVWFTLKTLGLTALVTALSRFVPRLRHDQMLTLCWKVLVPASLVNIGIVGVLALFVFGGAS